MMATSTQFTDGGDVISDFTGEQWTEDSCSEKTLVDESRGCGDDDDFYQDTWKDNREPSTKASCSEWVYGDHIRQGTDDDDEYKNSCGDDADTEPEQATEDGGSERTDSGDENEDPVWEHSTEESVSETTDDDQTCEESVDEAQTKDSNDGGKGCGFSSPTEEKGWNASFAITSGDWDYVDTPVIRVKSPAEIKYNELPFRTLHYFLTYALRILEATCLRTAGKHYRTYLKDLDWRRWNLVEGNDDYNCAYADWLGEDGVEVKLWSLFFKRVPGMRVDQDKKDILDSMDTLRNAAVHRGDTGGLHFKILERAMNVPVLLDDDVGKKEMTDLAEFVLGDGPMDEDVRADVERKMYTPRLGATKYRLLERIQTLLEESCYNLAMRKIPDVLKMNGWDCAEKVELQNWIDIFKNTEVVEHCDDLAKDFFRGYDSTILTNNIINLLHRARMDIRKRVAHRLPVSEEQVVDAVHTGIRTAILQSDWPRAIEIEVLSEMWIKGKSRQEVLARLARSYRDGNADTEYERRRRCELKIFLSNQQGHEEEEEDGEQLAKSADCDVEKEMVERVWTRSTWSPSMHPCLKMAEVVEVVDYVQDVSDEDSEKLASDSCQAGEDSENGVWGTPAEWAGSQLCKRDRKWNYWGEWCRGWLFDCLASLYWDISNRIWRR